MLQGKSPKKRKTEDVFERSKKVKSEISPIKAKKPIRLKKTIHPRKKLQPNQNMVMFSKSLIIDIFSYYLVYRSLKMTPLTIRYPQKEKAGMESTMMTCTPERVCKQIDMKYLNSFTFNIFQKTLRSRQVRYRRFGSCRRTSCSASWTRGPTSSAATATSGGCSRT